MTPATNAAATSAAPTILQQLRSGTADLHESLETALPLGSMDLTLDRYIQVLQGFRGFFAGWEPAARNAAPPALAPLLLERARTPLLDRDLAALGCIPELAIATALPAMSGIVSLLGSMYVLEGSRLGGQYLVRGLESRLGLTPQRGLSFFYGFGPQTGSQWKAFCAIVEQHVPPSASQEAVAAARSTFLAVHHWMAAKSVAAPAGLSSHDATVEPTR